MAVDADGGESEWSWSDIDKPALRQWLTETRHRSVNHSHTHSHSQQQQSSKDELTDDEYRQLLIAHHAEAAAAQLGEAGSGAEGAAQPPSPLSPDSAELAGSTSDEDEREAQQQQQQVYKQRHQQSAAAADDDEDEDDSTERRRDGSVGGHKRRRRDNGSAAPYITSDSDEERNEMLADDDNEDGDDDDQDGWMADDREAASRGLASTPPPSLLSSQQHQPTSPLSSSSSLTAHASKQRRVAGQSSGPLSLFDLPPFPLRLLRGDGDVEPSLLPAVDEAESVDPSLLQPSVPRPAPHTSLFDSLYSVPAEVIYDLRDESETDSEDEAAIASRLRLGCRFTALAGRRFAVPREPATFGWDWQASIALANRSGPLPLPLAAPTAGSLPSAASSSPSPNPSSSLSSSAGVVSSLSSVPSLSFPPTVEPGVAAHDGFDLPPVALPLVGFASVSMEEVDDERQRKRRRREDEARQHIPLAYRLRIDEMRDSHRGRRSSTSSTAASPALSHAKHRFFHDAARTSLSPSSLLSASLPSSPSSSSALLSLLDPPMPNKRWRQAWAALLQQLPQPLRAFDAAQESAAVTFLPPLSPRASAASEADEALDVNQAAARSSSPSPPFHLQARAASPSTATTVDASASPALAGRDTPNLAGASSASPRRRPAPLPICLLLRCPRRGCPPAACIVACWLSAVWWSCGVAPPAPSACCATRPRSLCASLAIWRCTGGGTTERWWT